ncbi:MAG TPA: L,D-transpeptidase family protein [Verrucomicrobiae bacterium]
MGKRANISGATTGTMLLRILFVASLSFGGWYGWRMYHGRKPELPKLPSVTFNRTNNPATDTITPAPQSLLRRILLEPTNSVAAITNLALPATNNPVAEPAKHKPPPEPEHPPRQVRNVQTVLDAQIALARKGISVGPIDGVAGENMKRALMVWQIHNGLTMSGDLDAETKAALRVEEPLFINYQISEEDLKRLMKIPSTWLGKSEAKRLDFETMLELVAETSRSSEAFIKKSNPQINWTNVTAGTLVKVPRIDPPPAPKAAFVRVHLYSKSINVYGKSTNLIAHFPCSIGSRVDNRPVGLLNVDKAALNPTYWFDPKVFPESVEAQKLGRKLQLPAGPNNPVGTAWIGLSRPGYGIHGTPKPEQIGRTESHGCFRLANWNAEHLLQMASPGMPVYVER